MGPVISSAHRSDVLRYIDVAREEGGEVLHGGGGAHTRPEDMPEQRAPKPRLLGL
jgi:acyl-CoA reductase-like NAD-dependent aldehyde dehydrogenase